LEACTTKQIELEDEDTEDDSNEQPVLEKIDYSSLKV